MRIVNLNNKTLREFTHGDTLYISKDEGGFQRIYLCAFLKIERGIVHAIVQESADWGKVRVGELITTRSPHCMLWGADKNGQNRCHWFKSLDTVSE
jgi:hypothetical protein